MTIRILAEFADGVLKPLTPLRLAEGTRVSLTVHPSSFDDEEWLDSAFLAEAQADADESISLDEVRQALAKIRQPLADAFREERDIR